MIEYFSQPRRDVSGTALQYTLLTMNGKNVLLIFVKNPEPGKVKTRLAGTIGDKNAYKIYLKLLEHTMREASQTGVDKQVWYSSFTDEDDFFDNIQFSKYKQEGANLGKRMKHAFKQAFESGYKQVVIIGSDCPGITKEIIEDAFAKLRTHDLIIGPSKDGGYYLLGMRKLYSGLFSDVSWSTHLVLEQTLNKAKALELAIFELPVLNDIDTEEDLKKSRFDWLKT